MKLTVFFDGKYWVGIIDIHLNGEVQSYKHTFGSEPNNSIIFDFVMKDLMRLFNRRDSLVIENDKKSYSINPKRMKRIVAKEIHKQGISAKSQEYISQIQSSSKKEKKANMKQENELRKQYNRFKKVEKRKNKKKGK